MAENQSSGRDPKTAAATTFSQLLFFADHDEDDDIDVDKHHHVHHQIFEYSVSSSFAIENPPKMLCFGTKQEQEHPQLGLRSAHACSDSVKRKNGSNPETTAIKPAPLSNQKASKKTKPEAPCSAGHAKVRQFLPCSCFFLCFYEMGFVFLVILEEGEARRKNHSATTIGFAVRQGCRKKKKTEYLISLHFCPFSRTWYQFLNVDGFKTDRHSFSSSRGNGLHQIFTRTNSSLVQSLPGQESAGKHSV